MTGTNPLRTIKDGNSDGLSWRKSDGAPVFPWHVSFGVIALELQHENPMVAYQRMWCMLRSPTIN